MKRILFISGLLLLGGLGPQRARAQAPAWQSAQVVATATGAATSTYSNVTATAVDAAGNVLLAGNFSNTVVLGGTTLTSRGGADVFVAKFNPASNQFVWAQRAGGAEGEAVHALAVSGSSVYVVGEFRSPTADFGGAALAATAGTDDVFVAKLTDTGRAGSFVWAQRVGGTENSTAHPPAGPGTQANVVGNRATALAVSGTSVYVAGSFSSPTATFGPVALPNGGDGDVFVAKLTDAGGTGRFVWAQRAGGTGDELATALAVRGTSVYVAGYFESPTAAFGPATLANGGPAFTTDVFVAKLTDAGGTGRFVWAQQAGGTDHEKASALAVNGTDVYVAGDFQSSAAAFGPAALATAGDSDVFVAKLADAGGTGRFVWAQRAGGPKNDYARTLAVNGTRVYVAGDFRSSTAAFGSVGLTNAGAHDVFVALLADAGPTGRFAWAQQAGGTGHDLGIALAVRGTSVYVVGSFGSPTVAFGRLTLTNPTTPTAARGFLAVLTDPAR